MFFNEMKRRNVVRVGFAYVVVGWLVAQIAEMLFPAFGTPDWVFKTLVLLIGIGLPFAMLFAWAFEMTPEGIKKTRDVDISLTLTHSTGRKLDFMIIGALAVALGYFIYERQFLVEATDELPAATVEAAAEETNAPPVETVDETVDEITRRSIAVLPFLNMSSDDEQAWFADGLTEEILNSLARAPDLLVSARTSSFAYKGTSKDIPTIAEELGVRHILEGSVRRGGDRVRVTAQLIRAEDGFHLWSQTYDRTLDDVIQIQEEVAIEIAKALETAMDPDALAQMMKAGTSSVPAFEAYLKGLAHGINTFTRGDAYEFLSARDSHERAIELDPEFAKAYWELAFFWDIQLTSTNIVAGITGLDRDEMWASYEAAIDKAILYEDDAVSALGYRANKASRESDLAQALRLNTEYIEQRPNDQSGQLQLLNSYANLRKFDEGVEAGLLMMERDGHDPFVAASVVNLMRFSNNKEKIRSFAHEIINQFGENIDVMYQAHRALLWAGDIDGSSKVLPRIQSSDLSGENRFLASLRQACAEQRLGDAEEMLAAYFATITEDVLDTDDRVSMRSTDWLTYNIMGDNDAALGVLKKLDDIEDQRELVDYVTYAVFDAREFPNLATMLESQGVGDMEPRLLPYRCDR